MKFNKKINELYSQLNDEEKHKILTFIASRGEFFPTLAMVSEFFALNNLLNGNFFGVIIFSLIGIICVYNFIKMIKKDEEIIFKKFFTISNKNEEKKK